MPEMREWITVKEAALLVGRAPRTIYEWIEDNRLPSRRNSAGVLEIPSTAVVRIEPTIRRGRPRGVATRRW